MTYQVDKIRRDISSMQTDKGLQTQVDKFYPDQDDIVVSSEQPPEEVDHL